MKGAYQISFCGLDFLVQNIDQLFLLWDLFVLLPQASNKSNLNALSV